MANTKKVGTTVTFIDISAEAKKTMQGLSKTALRESGKTIRKLLREKIAEPPDLIHSNRFKNHIGTWAFIDRTTGQPQLQVGLYSHAKVLKKGKKASRASPHWIEFGTKPHTMPGKKKKKKKKKEGHFMSYNNNFYGKEVRHPGQKPTHLLRDTVQNNIAEIRKAQEEYLALLNKTLEEAGAKIYEGEEDESD